MNTTVFQGLVLAGLFAIGVEVYQIRKQIKNIYRICTPMIQDWYERNPEGKVPRDED